MRINISNRLHPFSHIAGSATVLPGSDLQVQIFPMLIRLYSLNLETAIGLSQEMQDFDSESFTGGGEHSQKVKAPPPVNDCGSKDCVSWPDPIAVSRLRTASPQLVKEYPLHLPAPEKNFTVENDFERGVITVWWQSSKGFIRYCLYLNNDGMVRLDFDKGEKVNLYQTQTAIPAKITSPSPSPRACPKMYEFTKLIGLGQARGHEVLPGIVETQKPLHNSFERLSLGVHKKQDFDAVRTRSSIAEIWPFWFQLGQLIPQVSGKAGLLELWRNETKPENLKNLTLQLFKAGFHGIMAPRFFDDQYQGIPLVPHPQNSADFLAEAPVHTGCSPLVLLSEGYKIIRSHLIREKESDIFIIPLLPPELHCGRMTNVQLKGCIIDLEWSKKVIRRMILRSKNSQQYTFHFKHCKQFRLRTSHKDKGMVIPSLTPIKLERDHTYFFDNFS